MKYIKAFLDTFIGICFSFWLLGFLSVLGISYTPLIEHNFFATLVEFFENRNWLLRQICYLILGLVEILICMNVASFLYVQKEEYIRSLRFIEREEMEKSKNK